MSISRLLMKAKTLLLTVWAVSLSELYDFGHYKIIGDLEGARDIWLYVGNKRPK